MKKDHATDRGRLLPFYSNCSALLCFSASVPDRCPILDFRDTTLAAVEQFSALCHLSFFPCLPLPQSPKALPLPYVGCMSDA